MTYNILNYPNSTSDDGILVADTTGRNPYFRTTISSVNPDILVVQEIQRAVDADSFLVNVMNSSGDSYSMSMVGTTGDDNPIYYKHDKFAYISGSLVIDQGSAPAHPTIEYKLYHKLTKDTLTIFNVHLTATDTRDTLRQVEADSIRARSDAFSSGTNFIAIGDFNIYGGGDSTFTILLDKTNSGYFIDPLNLKSANNWSRDDLTEYNTNSTRMGANPPYLGGGNADGLDERFDLLLNSQIVVDSGGITYKSGSYVTYGNDGNHNNTDINEQPNTAVSSDIADALYMASDHLPIYADFNFGSPATGNIVFTQVGSDGDDVIEFITLYDKMDLTKLKVTNNTIDSNGDLQTGGGTYDLSNTPWKDVPGGTFVRLGANLTNDNNPSDRILKYDGTGSGTLPTLGGANGDQLIAYTGSSSAPYFISGITWGNDGWQTGAGDSYAPGTSSDIALGTSSNYYFNSSVNSDSATTRTALVNSSNWSSYAGGTYNDLTSAIGNGALPVELTFFTGKLSGDNFELRWRTETEISNLGFDIERMFNNQSWDVIGFVRGYGNSNSPKDYNFTDSDIGSSGKYYYRLKQIDTDGAYEYSNTITTTIGVPNDFSLSQNYPNPFNPETQIDFTLPEKQVVTLRVYNIIGELVGELINKEMPAGNYTIPFDASGISSGIYIYRLQTQNFVANNKMTVLK